MNCIRISSYQLQNDEFGIASCFKEIKSSNFLHMVLYISDFNRKLRKAVRYYFAKNEFSL